MKTYVVGFAFSANAQQVVLIRKQRPAWQAGKLNGVGGGIEADEAPRQAMAREFAEETGVKLPSSVWREYALNEDSEVRVHVFCCQNDAVLDAQSRTDEAIEIHALDDASLGGDLLEGVQQLIGLALLPEGPLVRLATVRPKAPAP